MTVSCKAKRSSSTFAGDNAVHAAPRTGRVVMVTSHVM
jgi:hypothetical protein